MSQRAEDTGAESAYFDVDQSIGEMRGGKVVGVEIREFYSQMIVQADSIEDLEELPPAPGEPPYKGLAYYTEDDADIFFGREKLSDDLAARLRKSRFLAIVGASGSGKSSVLRAGVVPRLRAHNWRIHIIKPGADPLRALANSLTKEELDPAATDAMATALAADPDTLLKVGDKLAARHDAEGLLLAVDQFEETFTQCKDPEKRNAFVANLVAVAQAQGATTVAISIRADFYDRVSEFTALTDLVAQQQEYVKRMAPEELVRVIAEPAKRGGWQFVEGLVEQFVEAVGREPGRLPLLSHALLETWKRRRGVVMTLGGYRDAGGVEGAIAQTADETLKRLIEQNPGFEEVTREIFLELTELGEGTEDTRRVADRAELSAGVAGGALDAVLEELIEARLVTVRDGEVEVAHEALIRRWPRLREWLEDNRERLRFERQLARDAREWERLERDTGALYRGARLARAVEWWEEEGETRYGEQINPVAEAFLEESRDLAEREAREEAARRQRELEQERALAEAHQKRAEEAEAASAQLRRRRNIAFGLAAGALVLALATAILFGQSNRNAARAENNLATATRALAVAESERVRADGNAATATRNLATAVAAEATSDANARLAAERAEEAEAAQATAEAERAAAERQARIAEARALAAQAAEAADRDFKESLLLAVHAVEETVGDGEPVVIEASVSLRRTLASDRGYSVALGHADQVISSAFSPDGERVVTASGDGSARLWDVSGRGSADLMTRLEGHIERVNSVAFSRDGELLVTASDDSTARLWDAETGAPLAVLEEHTRAVNLAAFSPGGEVLVTASEDGTARLWDAAGDGTGEVIAVLEGHTGSVVSAVFSPNGERVVTASAAGRARLWDAETGASLATLEGHTARLWSAAFSPDGERVVTASGDGTARLWNGETGVPLGTLEGHTGPVVSAVFSPDGKRVVTASGDDTARLWDASGNLLAVLEGHTDNVVSAAFSPDGERVVTASNDGTARLWDGETGESLTALEGHNGPIYSAAFSPDGERIVTAGADDTARLWDASGNGFGALMVILEGHAASVWSAIVSPDGERVVTVACEEINEQDTCIKGTTRLWDAEKGTSLGTLDGHAGWVSSAAFSPDGERVVTASGNDSARLWDAETGAPLAVLVGHYPSVFSAAFSPDGERIVTTSGDIEDSVRLWDGETGAPLAVLQRYGYREPWYGLSATFSPDGKRVVTAGRFDNTRLLDASGEGSDELIAVLEGHTGTVYLAAFSPNGDRLVTASEDRTARLWDGVTGALLVTLEGHTGKVYTAAFSPDGERVVTASEDRTARLWDGETGALLATLEGHTGRVYTAAFSRDGERVVTASRDGTARLWDGRTGAALAILEGHTDAVNSAAFSPDGERVITASDDGTARIWTVGVASLLAEARRQLLPMLTLEECKTYFPEDCPPNATEVPLP